MRNRDLAKTLLEQKNQKKEEMRKKIEENKAKKLDDTVPMHRVYFVQYIFPCNRTSSDLY